MNILVISSRDLDKGSTRFRIAQYESFLNDNDIQIDYVRRKDINSDIIRRLSGYDLVFNQKCLMNRFITRRILAHSRRVLFDYDDAIWTRPGKPYGLFTGWRVRSRLKQWLRHADIVTPANEYLARYARQFTPNVQMIPMAIDMNQWQPQQKTADRVVIGWAGAPVNIANVERLGPVLKKVLQRYPQARLAVYSGRKPQLDFAFDHHPFEPGTEADFIKTLDIGLLPLIDDDYIRGKSPIKAIQYIACGVPVVGNIHGASHEILNRDNSLPVTTDADWEAALGQLIEDAALRQRLGQAGRQHAEACFDINKVRQQLLQLLRGESAHG